MKKRLICLGMALIFSLAGGCSSAPAPPSFYPVRGQIVLDGQPVRFANVSLTPKDLVNDDAPAATGRTDANGEFSIQTYMGPGYDGALPGEYWVSLATPARSPGDANGVTPSAIPKQYRHPKTSKISITVREETNDLGTIRLRS